MDALRAATLARKESAARAKATTGKTWVKRGDMAKQKAIEEVDRLAERHRQEEVSQVNRLAEMESHLNFKKQQALRLGYEVQEELQEYKPHEVKEGESPLPLREVIRQLRLLGEPITLYGENEIMRYMRLRSKQVDELEDDYLKTGRQGKKRTHDMILEETEQNEKKAEEEQKEEEEAMEEVGQDAQEIVAWIKKVMRMWEHDLQVRPEAEKKTAKGRMDISQYRSSRKDIKPMVRQMRHNEMDALILYKVHGIVQHAEKHEYQQANTIYMELAIGNAAWPVGVKGSSIHARTADQRREGNTTAQILNDETTRKWVQTLKRLVTFDEEKYKLSLAGTNEEGGAQEA